LVTIALGADGGTTYGPASDVGRDEVGEHRGDGEAYGAILLARARRQSRSRATGPLAA